MSNETKQTLIILKNKLVKHPTITQTNKTIQYIFNNEYELMNTLNFNDVFNKATSINTLENLGDTGEDRIDDLKEAKAIKRSPYKWFHTGAMPVKTNELIQTLTSLINRNKGDNRMKQLTDKDLDTRAKQIKAVKDLYHDFKDNHVTNYQAIANNLFTIAGADHETSVSDNVLYSMQNNYIDNVASWHEEDYNHLYYNDYNMTDQKVYPSLKKMMKKCKEQHIDPNNYWVTTDMHDNIVPIGRSDITLVFDDLCYTVTKNGKKQLEVEAD